MKATAILELAVSRRPPKSVTNFGTKFLVENFNVFFLSYKVTFSLLISSEACYLYALKHF